MGREVLSNRQKRLRRRTEPKPARAPKGDAVVRVGPPATAQEVEPSDRDGLLWLAKKKRLSARQLKAALRYRDLFRALKPGGVTQSCLLSLGMGGGGGSGGGYPGGGSYGDAQAQLELFAIHSLVLRNEPDMILVMEGVCGIGHTVRFLAGNDQKRSHELEQALRIALNMLAENEEAKAKALERQKAA